MIGGHDDGTPVVASRLASMSSVGRPVVALPVHVRCVNVVWIGVAYERFVLRLTIYIEHFFAHVERIAGNTNETLHIVLVAFVRGDENNNVTAARLCERWQTPAGARHLRAVHGLVHEEEVAHQERVLHAARRYTKRLHQEGADEQKEGEGDEEEPGPFPGPTCCARSRRSVGDNDSVEHQCF